MAAWWSYFSTVSHSNSKHFQSFSTFIYLHLLCFSSSSSNTCPILPTESCLLVWKYVLLHSSVKQPTCISPSDQALIAFPNLIIKSLLFLFFFVCFIGLYLHTFAFCNAVMEVCYIEHTFVCFPILIHIFLVVQEIHVVRIGLPLVRLHHCILGWVVSLKCVANTILSMVLFCMDIEGVWMIQQISSFGRSASTVAALLYALLPAFLSFQTYLSEVNIATGEEIKA